MSNILIDNVNLRILKRVPTVRQAEIWAELLIPHYDFRVQGPEGRWWAAYDLVKLKRIYFNTFSGQQLTTLDYPTALRTLTERCSELELDETPEAALLERLGRPMPPTAATAPGKRPQVRDSTPNTVFYTPPNPTPKGAADTRPKAGTTTGRVWQIADEEATKFGEKAGTFSKDLRNSVMQRCATEGINSSTAATQFGKWKGSKSL